MSVLGKFVKNIKVVEARMKRVKYSFYFIFYVFKDIV